MIKLTVIGALSCLGGILILGFQAISSLMTPGDIVWKTLNLASVLAPTFVEWIDGISWQVIHSPVERIITMPLYLLLICVGVLSLIIGGITQR